MVDKSQDGLLTFDEDSPLFVKKKKTRNKPQKKKPVAAKKHTLKYTVKSPTDCKHIPASFKKKLEKVWSQLESDDNMKSAAVPGYIRGVALVIKKSRPKEFEELRVLVDLARQILNDR